MIKTLFITIALLSANSFADKVQIINNLEKFFGQIDAQDINKTPFKGVYEVTTYNPIDSMLVSEDGRFLIQGDVVDLSIRQVMGVSDKVKQLKQSLIDTINDVDKIIYPANDEKYIVHVFTDVDCPFCKKLHREIDSMNDLGISVKYLASPLASLHPTAQGKMQKIWCADDRNQAMDNYNIDRSIPDVERCKNPVVKQLKISQQLGVTGTPAIFLSDGTHLPGYLPAEKLLTKIQATLGN